MRVQRNWFIRFFGLSFGLAALLCAVGPDAEAHDYWLEQHPVPVGPGDMCSMHLMVGDELTAELERPFQKDITSRFDWFLGGRVIALADSQPDSTVPVFERRLEDAGVSLLVMDRDFVTIETTVGQFLDFLKHEEQPNLAVSYEDADPEAPLSRRYKRSIKALLRSGEPVSDELHDKAVGQQTEIRLLSPPHSLALGEEFQVHVSFEDTDLPDQLVRAMVRGSDGAVTILTSETDHRGIATFTFVRSGLWLIRVAFLRQCAGDCEADWDTHYAVFSFVH